MRHGMSVAAVIKLNTKRIKREQTRQLEQLQPERSRRRSGLMLGRTTPRKSGVLSTFSETKTCRESAQYVRRNFENFGRACAAGRRRTVAEMYSNVWCHAALVKSTIRPWRTQFDDVHDKTNLLPCRVPVLFFISGATGFQQRRRPCHHCHRCLCGPPSHLLLSDVVLLLAVQVLERRSDLTVGGRE